MVSFEKLRLEWNSLAGDMQAKNKFIKDNKDAFEDLGIQVRGVSDAENVFVTNTDAFRTALMERAKALASAELAQEAYKKFLEKDLESKSSLARGTEAQISTKTITTAGGETIGTEVVFDEEFSRKRQKAAEEAAEQLKKFNDLMAGSIEHQENYQKILADLGVTTTENLEKIALLEQKISEQEKLMLEAAEAGNRAEVKVIQDKIEQLQEELRLRNMLVNAIYAQSRANELITNMQSGAWQPAGAPAGSIGAPSTGGKAAGSRYWQTPVFDLNTAKQTLAVMDQQAANARNAEGIAKKKKKTDEEAKKIAEDELEVRLQIADAISQTVGALQSAGLVSEQTANMMRDVAKGFEQLLTGNFIGFFATTISQMIIAFSGMLDSSETKAEQLNRQIEEMNKLLEYQERLIERAGRTGGERDARQEAIDILTGQYEDLNAQLEKYQAEYDKLAGKDVVWRWQGDPGEAKKMIDELTPAVEEARQALEDAQQALNDLLSGGVTQNTIADSIAEGFRSGKASVRDFADYMNNILLDAVTKAFSTRILGEQINNLTELIGTSIESGGALTDEEIAKIRSDYLGIVESSKETWEKLTQGLNLGDVDATLKGAIKGITEETAGVLAGQVNAMRINQVEGVLIMRQQLMHLAKIAANSDYQKHLASIDRKLDALSSDSLRASGLNG
jgi:predicted component of type VI protein secretion system